MGLRYRIIELNNGRFFVHTTENPNENAQWEFWKSFDSERAAMNAINEAIAEEWGCRQKRLVRIIERDIVCQFNGVELPSMNELNKIAQGHICKKGDVHG